VKRLINQLHQQQTEALALQLQLNNVILQKEMLRSSEQSCRSELDQLRFQNATLEQDKLLLEVNTKNVSFSFNSFKF
jgi:hypothetical protein